MRVDLGPHFNNVGITRRAETGLGALNVWRNSLPAEDLPVGQEVAVAGIPFRFPAAGDGRPDNVRCAGQFVPVAPGAYDWLHLLGAAERRVEEEVAIHFRGGQVDFESLRLSDFWAAPAVFGEAEAFTTPRMHYPNHVQEGLAGMLWGQRLPVTRREALAAVRLPRNPAVHLFAATLESDERVRR